MKIELSQLTLSAATFASALLIGCSADSGARRDSTRGDSTVAATGGAAGVNVDANATTPAHVDSSHAGVANVVSFAGVPPLRIGMSEVEARQALGMPASSAKGGDDCRYLDTKGRSHAFVMLVRDTVVRLDVRDSVLATEAGAHVGDPESRVLQLYRGRVTSEPHKYVASGHYLVVRSPSDSTRRLVFETDGAHVTTFRVGRMPEVAWVEGCS